MISARGVALIVTTASVQLRMLQNSVYLPRGQSYQQLTIRWNSAVKESGIDGGGLLYVYATGS
jgi:hypothetical protein